MRTLKSEWLVFSITTSIKGSSVISNLIFRWVGVGAEMTIRRVSRMGGSAPGRRQVQVSVITISEPEACSITGPSERICPRSLPSCQ